MEDIILVGGGGHCKSVIDTIINSNLYNIYGIIDIKDNVGKKVCGIKVIDCDENLSIYRKKGIKNAFITLGSIGNTSIRRNLYQLLIKNGFQIPRIIDKTSIVSDRAIIDSGVFVGKGAIINVDSKIGKNSIINSGSIIEHDCILEEFVHISPGVTLCGGVKIGKNSHIGANSTIIQFKNIGENVIIGAGSIVVKDINSNTKAFGNPCRER